MQTSDSHVEAEHPTRPPPRELMSTRDYDLVIFGATGDAGRAMTTLLAESSPPDLRWTIAGRSRSKLEALAGAGSKREVLVADCADDEALLVLAARTRVLISAAGPFSMLGERVMLACIEAKTHYVDITGEVPWVAEMRRLHGARARAAGVCMASFCGYDCLPCELGLYLGRQALGTGLTLSLSLSLTPTLTPTLTLTLTLSLPLALPLIRTLTLAGPWHAAVLRRERSGHAARRGR